jgi:23S rRNA G2445 N2-methylase RlmL
MTRLLNTVGDVIEGQDASSFSTLSIDAAGSDSSVMQRIKQELAAACGLQVEPDKGDLHLRIRRSLTASGWDVLIRTTPRPLVTRSWRVRNYEGALNATVAAAMVTLLGPHAHEPLLNLMCGSGSLMIVRLESHPESMVIGCDVSSAALACSAENLQAFGTRSASLLQAEVAHLPFANSSFSLLAADLPFGQLIGSHDDNRTLYPAVLSEALRVASTGARFAVITHEIKLIETALRGSGWITDDSRMITLRGLHPRIYVLRKP